jgi:phage terminase large subunit-like protein
MQDKAWPPKWLTPVDSKHVKKGEGDLVIKFAEAFGIITKDSVAGLAGSPLVLRDWQKDLIRNIFAHEDGGLVHRTNLIGMPRKNGKSALGSVLALYSLILGPRGGEVYSVAAEKEQARIVFADAKKMIESSAELTGITKLYRDAIEVPSLGSVYRVLSAESYSKEGLNPHFVLFDELHAQPKRDLFDVMSLAQGSRGSLATLVAITTAGVKADSSGKDSIAYELKQYGEKVARGEIDDPSFFMAWWESDGDYRAPETWKLANPGFGDLNAAADFESAVRRTPEAEFRTKRCNQWVSSQNSWLTDGLWESRAGEFVIDPDDEIILGFDGSFNNDATVIVGATIPKDGEPVKVFMVKSWEKDLTLHDDDWRVDIGEVEATIIDFCKRHKNVREIACDPFRWERSMQILESDYGLPIVKWPSTSPKRMVPACAKFKDAIEDNQLIHDNDPMLARHLSNAVIKTDQLGPRIVKENRNSPRKIDAAVAAIIAVDRALTGRIEEPVPEFFY